MPVIRNIGKNTLGDNSKLQVAMHDYEMSNHNLSFVFRNTQSPGTLVPFMKLPAQKGDVFDIQLINKTLTHPTIGPLFGSYKLQHFVFSCPIRLYNSWLHNNRLGIGMKMSDVKLPKLMVELATKADNNTNPSSLLNYMGFKGVRKDGTLTNQNSIAINALPFLMYTDIFKNYFANKQEKDFYYINGAATGKPLYLTFTGKLGGTQIEVNRPYTMSLTNYNDVEIIGTPASHGATTYKEIWDNLNFNTDQGTKTAENIFIEVSDANKLTLASGAKTYIIYSVTEKNGDKGIVLTKTSLEELDEIRDVILQTPGNTPLKINGNNTTHKGNYFQNLQKYIDRAQQALIVKTYDSDIFQNWVNTDWIDGENGISEVSAVDVSEGKLTMDSLNLAQKVYNMLNRIAVSGGTYRDWLETVYTAGHYIERPETPVFEGGMTQFIEFEEVISQSATEDEPLGTLAGRGKTTNQMGSGRMHIKIAEPSYLIGIVAITPMIDYCQGNEWDMLAIDTMDDWHKPALDGIGYEDSINGYRAWWATKLDDLGHIQNTAAGKSVAWIEYMTNFNKTFGNFAAGMSEEFMVLNRNYEQNEFTIEDLTTYIDPSKHNEIFADTSLDAMNFWLQTAVQITVRRNISAKQIPNL